MRLPKIRSVKQEDSSVLPSGETELGDESGYAPEAPALEGRPDLTSKMARSVRFDIMTPRGYFFPQVEEYTRQAASAIEWYENALYQEQQRAHQLQVELDHQTYDVQRLRVEIEVFKEMGNPLTNADGSYITESQQQQSSNTSGLEAELVESQNEIARLTQSLQHAHDLARLAEQDLEEVQERAAQHEQEIARFREWSERITNDYAALQQHNSLLETTLQDTNAELQVTQQQLEQAYGEIDQLRVEVTAAVADAHAARLERDTRSAQVEENVVVPIDVSPTEFFNETHLPQGPERDVAGNGESSVDRVHVVEAEPVSVHVPVALEETSGSYLVANTAAEETLEESDAYDDTDDEELEEYDDNGEEEDDDGEEDDGEGVTASGWNIEEPDGHLPLAVPPIDSELPDGVPLPPLGPPSIEYPPAWPGAPLSNGEVPVEVYAPELDPASYVESDEAEGDGSVSTVLWVDPDSPDQPVSEKPSIEETKDPEDTEDSEESEEFEEAAFDEDGTPVARLTH